MRIIFSAILFLLSAMTLAGELFNSATLKATDTAPVVLRGVVNGLVFPVPDAAELGSTQSGWALSTVNDVECEGSFEEEKKTRATINLFQLAMSEEVSQEIEKAEGKPVELTGTVFAAHTRHHRTTFLLQVESVRLLSR